MEDHFAKALGDTWVKLQAEAEKKKAEDLEEASDDATSPPVKPKQSEASKYQLKI